MNTLCRSAIFFCATIALIAQHSVASDDDAVAQYSERAIELLRDAISRETAYGQGLVPAYAESLRQVFLEAGFSPEALTIVPYGETASLVVRYEGDGSSGRKPILFSSHMDVVPADPESWLRHPFELQEDDVFFYGRGVLDNKFDVTILTTLFVWLKESGFVPNRDLVIAFTGDEESFQETVQQLTGDYRDLVDAEYALVVDGGGGVLNDAGEAIALLRAQPEYVGTLGTTCIPTMLSGGHAENALPRAVTATVNCRIFPGHTPADIMRELQRVADDPALEWAVVGVPVASPASSFNPEIMTAIEQSLAPIHPNLPIVPEMGSGTTDGAYWRAAGIPSYSFTGIFINPKDSFAHGLNERVPKTAVGESLRFWRSMIDELASSHD